MRILIIGDTHLGKGVSIGKPGIGNALNSRIQDQMKLFDWIVDQAIENNVNSVIFTGDICEESKPDYVLLEIFIELLKKLEIYNISVEIVAGNHDIKRTGNYYKSFLDLLTAADLPTVQVHKYINTIFKGNIGITLMPFRDRRSLSCDKDIEAFEKLSSVLVYELESIPTHYDKIIVGHLALEGSIFVGDEFDNEANELMCPLEMFKGYDYVWMGHVHKPQVKSNKPYIAHIGSLDISDFGETDHEKIIVLYDSDNPNKFTNITVPSRPLIRVQIDVPEGFNSTNYVIDQIKALDKIKPFKNAIVKVEIKLMEDAENINRELVEKEIYKLNAYYICNLSESRNIIVVNSTNKTIDSTIDAKLGIKLYADLFDLDDQEKNEFIDLANSFVDLYKEKTV